MYDTFFVPPLSAGNYRPERTYALKKMRPDPRPVLKPYFMYDTFFVPRFRLEIIDRKRLIDLRNLLDALPVLGSWINPGLL